MIDHEKTTAADASAPPSTHVEPPKVYIPACGVLCDIFWWARRDLPAGELAPLPAKNETP
jgi:hypothetical protein